MRWIKKMIGTFQNCHDVLYQHAKFGEIELRAPYVGAKICVFTCATRQHSVVPTCYGNVSGWLAGCLPVTGGIVSKRLNLS